MTERSQISQRFTVVAWGRPVLHGATYDQVYSAILVHHQARQKTCGFRIDFSVKHYDPREVIPYGGGYAIVDNHTEK